MPARQRFIELLQGAIERSREQGLVGEEGSVMIPLIGYTGKTDTFGRGLADLEFMHDAGGAIAYSDYAKGAVFGAAYQHGMNFGVPYDRYLATFSMDERNKVRKFFEKYQEDRAEELREYGIDRIAAPSRLMRQEYADMISAGDYSVSSLTVFRGGIEGHIDASLSNIQGFQEKITLYQEQMAYMLSQQPDDAPEDPLLQGIFESRQASIEDLEAQVKAEEENIKNYQRVLRESGQALSQLKTALHKAEMDNIKATHSLAVQQAQEMGATLQEALQKQKDVRTLLTDRLAGDPEFVKNLEGENIQNLEGLGAEARGKFEQYEKQVEDQTGRVASAFTTMNEAYDTFQKEQTAESGEAYDKAKQAYNIEIGRLGNLEQLRDAYKRQMLRAEGGIDRSEAAIKAAEAYEFKAGLKGYAEDAKLDSDYVGNFLSAMGVYQEGVLKQGLIGAPMQNAYQRLENLEGWLEPQ